MRRSIPTSTPSTAAAADLAQPQRAAGLHGVPAHVPQCVRGTGQHLHARTERQRLQFPQRRQGQGRRLGLHRTQARAAGRRSRCAGVSCTPTTARRPTAPSCASTCRRRSRPAPAPRSTSTSSTSCRAWPRAPAISAASTSSASGSRRSACWNCPANAAPPRRAGTCTSSTCTASSTPTSAATTCASPCPRATPSAPPAKKAGTPVERDGKVTHRFVQDDVHDFAWTADKRYRQAAGRRLHRPRQPAGARCACCTRPNTHPARSRRCRRRSIRWRTSRARSARIRTGR